MCPRRISEELGGYSLSLVLPVDPTRTEESVKRERMSEVLFVGFSENLLNAARNIQSRNVHKVRFVYIHQAQYLFIPPEISS